MSDRAFGNRVRLFGGVLFGFLLASVFAWAGEPKKPAAPDNPVDLTVRSLTVVDKNNTPRIVLFCNKRDESMIILQGPTGRYPCMHIQQFNDREGVLRMLDERGVPVAVFSSPPES